ncbi:isopentenyl-diphosphate Delta-isomerase [Nakamurella leprariae]|uniref:isopentenyl-diphosphate Delta-isomerase n=1 Tax=Nakamurella leprariae TaxID=2803911 RepID=UPI002E2C510C|nr:isopentenyl-diphosphate Delta-isomerase [Nakamurella leprariae]
MSGVEQVVLLDEDGAAVGTADKSGVHGPDTPLHLAFSCYLFDADGRLLVTRRAFGKTTWPGVRTNTCCGHPGPGEPIDAAVHRRLASELGVHGVTLELVLPRFRYRAVMADGTVEHELCPVFRGVLTGPVAVPEPDPTEVAECWWQPWAEFVAAADPRGDGAADPLSPWGQVQVAELTALGPDPLHWPVGDAAALPPAARLAV